jgi:hypothetical protein
MPARCGSLPPGAGPIAGEVERIESMMEVEPKPGSQPPMPDGHAERISSPHPPVWAQRLLLAIEVSIAIWTGILVLVLPWTYLWTENPLLAAWPTLKLVLNLTFVRGMISGVGVVDIWMGVSDALHYRDRR